MATEIKLPELGENLEGGEVLDVKVAEGDTVNVGQSLLEVEAEKSTVEVPAPQAGKIAKLLVKKGDQIKVGQTLCLIEGGGTAKTREAPAKHTSPAPDPEPPHAFASEGGDEAGSDADEAAATLPEKPRPQQRPPQGNGQREKHTAPRQEAHPGESGRLVPAGPATRRLARELGIDLSRVPGTAAGGRVTSEDVKAYVRGLAATVPSSGRGTLQAPPLPDFGKWGPIDKQPLESIRRRTAEQMALAWSLIPHVTQHDEADITALDAFRREQGNGGPKLTVTAFALKACALALKEFPQFNASIDVAGGQIVYKRYYHIGVAVDTERGLLVPVIRDVDRKGLRELAQELADVAQRARDKKLSADDMRGSTFTITNLGGIGGTAFTPIVNYPEVAILGLSRGRMQPVFLDGQVTPRLILPLSLSYDHRLVDGAAAARFTRRLAEMFENPMLMLL